MIFPIFQEIPDWGEGSFAKILGQPQCMHVSSRLWMHPSSGMPAGFLINHSFWLSDHLRFDCLMVTNDEISISNGTVWWWTYPCKENAEKIKHPTKQTNKATHRNKPTPRHKLLVPPPKVTKKTHKSPHGWGRLVMQILRLATWEFKLLFQASRFFQASLFTQGPAHVHVRPMRPWALA